MTFNSPTLCRLALAVTATVFLGLVACSEKPSEPSAQKDEQTTAAVLDGDAKKLHEDAEDGHSHASGEKDAH